MPSIATARHRRRVQRSNGVGAIITGKDGTRPIRFSVLGPLRAWWGDAPVPLGPARQQAVLAVLLASRGVARTPEDLLGAVWGGRPPASGPNLVAVYLYRLRAEFRAAGATEVIARDRSGYRIAGAVDVDADRLDDLLGRARAALAARRTADAEAALTAATVLCTGEPLTGLPGPFAATERQRLQERGLDAWRRLVELWIRAGRAADAIDTATRLIATHPYDESLVALLMRARYRGGWAVEALQDYRELRDRLVGDLGVEPGHELRALHQAILRGDDVAVGLGARLAVAATDGAHRRNELPADVGRLDGRADAIDALTGLLSSAGSRLVAVDGAAGVGKTTLVVHVAHRLRRGCPDGTLFLDLYGHTAGRQPVPAAEALNRLLRTIGVPDRDVPDELDERAAVWRAATADARLLVVLDNAASADQVRPLLPGGARNQVLVTSRRRLGELDVDGQLTVPVLSEAAGVALLSADVGGARVAAEPAAVREVVRRCGRLPLALRIAAARMRTRPGWTFRYLADRLADGADRLAELAVGERSVESAFALSYARLPAAEQRVFRMLGEVPGVVPDRYGMAALAGVAAVDAERMLEDLVDASLLDAATPGRYRIHDLIRDYAGRLAAADPDPAALDRLLDHARFAVAAATRLLSPGIAAHTDSSGTVRSGTVPSGAASSGTVRSDTVPSGAASSGTVRSGTVPSGAAPSGTVPSGTASLDAVSSDAVSSDAVSSDAVSSDAVSSGAAPADGARAEPAARPESDEPADRIGRGDPDGPVESTASTAAGTLPFGDAAGAEAWLADSRATLVELVRQAARAGRVEAAGRLALDTVDPYSIRTWFDDARRMHDSVLAVEHDPARRAELQISVANVHGMRGAYRLAADGFRRAREQFAALGDDEKIGRALGGLGATARSMGRYEDAVEHLTEAMRLADRLGHAKLKTLDLLNLGMLHGELRRHDLARAELRAALAAATERGDQRLRTVCLFALGELLCRIGPTHEARAVLDDALALAERTGDVLVRGFALTHLGLVAERSGDPETAIARHLSALRLVHPDAVESTIEIRNNLGGAYLAAGRRAEARTQFRAALTLTETSPSPAARAHALAGLTRC